MIEIIFETPPTLPPNLTEQRPSEPKTKRELFISKLREQRENRKDVDCIKMLEAYPFSVRMLIVQTAQHIQCTDGCTGGCPWCGFDVRRKITTGFSFESLVELFNTYGLHFPKKIALYWASDPLDIAGEKENGELFYYPDLIREIIDSLEPNQRIYTSTVMPEGTYAIARDLLVFFHRHWLEHNYYPDNDNLLFTVRFSETEKNTEQIAALKQELLEMGLDHNYVNAQFAMAESRNQQTVKKLGKQIKHPDRNIYSLDIASIACYDGVLIRPDGLYAITMEAATSESPFGHTWQPLVVQGGELAIPIFQSLDYLNERISTKKILKGEIPALLPNVRLNIVDAETGEILRVQEQVSLRRDLMAFIQAYLTLNLLREKKLSLQQKYVLLQYNGQLDSRWEQTQSLLDSSSDEEAKSAVLIWYKDTKQIILDLLSSQD